MYLHQVLRFLFLKWPVNVRTDFTLLVVPNIDSLSFFVVEQGWDSPGLAI